MPDMTRAVGFGIWSKGCLCSSGLNTIFIQSILNNMAHQCLAAVRLLALVSSFYRFHIRRQVVRHHCSAHLYCS
ncbi:hypothetical protein AQUCO_00800066v1 [Aquilegia coerulea]|uniref:Uncharacterized protein n=1 Tax=Aquilegia coerulea TaxID=218851 RepID=A0A2G5EH76_AQUCA|nr:hypothetical protein AQUCO_00800066v1 [Aquilegia coerulea]